MQCHRKNIQLYFSNMSQVDDINVKSTYSQFTIRYILRLLFFSQLVSVILTQTISKATYWPWELKDHFTLFIIGNLHIDFPFIHFNSFLGILLFYFMPSYLTLSFPLLPYNVGPLLSSIDYTHVSKQISLSPASKKKLKIHKLKLLLPLDKIRQILH